MTDEDPTLTAINDLAKKLDPNLLFLNGNGRRPASERLGRVECVTYGTCAVVLVCIGAIVTWGLGYLT